MRFSRLPPTYQGSLHRKGEAMIGKSIALIKEVPTQRMFSPGAAAQYLGIALGLLKELTDTGELACYDFRGRRAYKLEDLDRLIDSLEQWKTHAMKNGV